MTPPPTSPPTAPSTAPSGSPRTGSPAPCATSTRRPPRVAAVTRYWKGYAGEVLAHHTDRGRRLLPRPGGPGRARGDLIARTDAEHHRLDEATDAVEAAIGSGRRRRRPASAGLADAPGALAALMDDHLEFEDAEILPLFERHFNGEEFDAMDQAAIKASASAPRPPSPCPSRRLWPRTPCGPSCWPPPPAPWVLYRATRRRHARLEARAFGVASRPRRWRRDAGAPHPHRGPPPPPGPRRMDPGPRRPRRRRLALRGRAPRRLRHPRQRFRRCPGPADRSLPRAAGTPPSWSSRPTTGWTTLPPRPPSTRWWPTPPRSTTSGAPNRPSPPRTGRPPW